MGDRTRWKWRFWSWFCKVPNVCPAGAHTLIIVGERCDPRVNWMCREDLAANGICWCGKLKNEAATREVQ